MSQYYSLAESFARRIIKPQHPPDKANVGYVVRIYPELNSEELLRLFEANNRRPLSSRQLSELYYGWVASLDYCNLDTEEIIHRGELIRDSKQQLHTALWEYEETLQNQRQRRAYREWLFEYFGIQP
jgi:hypothetical protein